MKRANEGSAGILVIRIGWMMGKLNNELNYLLRDNQVFADMVNLCIYQENRVKAEELTKEDSVLYPDDGKKSRERRNDVCKKCSTGHTYRIISFENETKTDYLMLLRCMEYDVGRYREQVEEIQAGYQEKEVKKDWNSLASRFRKSDRLNPVITIVLYWSRTPWDGARKLTDMLEIAEEEKEKLAPFLQEYHLNLVNMYDLKNLDLCKSQLKYILKLLKFDQDKKALYQELKSDPEYKRMSFRAGKAAGYLLGSRKIEKILENDREGSVDMCKALDDLWNEALEEGEIRTIIKQIIKKMQKQKTTEQIADEIEQELSYVERIYQIATECAPLYDEDEIYQRLIV